MNALSQFLQVLFSGMIVGFKAFIGALQVKNIADGIKEQMLASLFGVPVWVISLISFLTLIGGVAFAFIKRQHSRN